MSRVGDVRCIGCALVDNMRAGVELNRLSAPYNTTGTIDTIIAVNTRATSGHLLDTGSSHVPTANDSSSALATSLSSSAFPHWERSDPDKGSTYGWCVYNGSMALHQCIGTRVSSAS
jgi:hypothetical protein